MKFFVHFASSSNFMTRKEQNFIFSQLLLHLYESQDFCINVPFFTIQKFKRALFWIIKSTAMGKYTKAERHLRYMASGKKKEFENLSIKKEI